LALTTATAAHAKSGKFGSKRTRRSCVSSQVLRSVMRQASPHRMGAVAPAHASAMNRANRTRIRTGPRNNRQPSIARSAFQTAEPAIAGGIIAQGVEQIGRAEFGPAFLRDPYFRIADLPQQKIADTHF